MAPLTTADLLFSEQANHNFSKTLGELKRHTLSISNRLQSILTDAVFVQNVCKAYARPLIANERCGSWYIDPQNKDGSAYFKSTDGHTGVWKFSTRRLNTHLLKEIGLHDGCIIVDSTRRGKRMPDALSKTIPIWCCVMNRVIFPKETKCHNLYTPPQVVSLSEHAQISTHIESFVNSFVALGIDIRRLRSLISKPLRPVWVTPESNLALMEQVFEDFHPVICCTASRRVTGGELSEGGYIQGSGDDTENWAFGLTPTVFWENRELLMSTTESDLPELIAELVVKDSAEPVSGVVLKSLAPTSSLYIFSLAMLASQPPGVRSIMISLSTDITDSSTWKISPRQLNVGIGPHKLGSRNLRPALPHILEFVMKTIPLPNKADETFNLFIACSSGKDHSVGVALSLLCLLYDEEGKLLHHDERGNMKVIDKNFIRRRLGWIMTSMPHVNPSRSTLQSVNSYLMDRPDKKVDKSEASS